MTALQMLGILFLSLKDFYNYKRKKRRNVKIVNKKSRVKLDEKILRKRVSRTK